MSDRSEDGKQNEEELTPQSSRATNRVEAQHAGDYRSIEDASYTLWQIQEQQTNEEEITMSGRKFSAHKYMHGQS